MGDYSVSDEELMTLMNGTARRADSTSRERAQMTFDSNVEAVAMGLVEMALDKRLNPSIRLKAATYCVDRVLGPTSTATKNDEVNDVLMSMVKNFTKAE